MHKKIGLAILFVAVVNNVCSQDSNLTIHLRKDMMPASKVFWGNVTISTLVGAALIATGAGINQLINSNQNRIESLEERWHSSGFNYQDFPCIAITGAGIVILYGSFIYNLIKLAHHWRKSGQEELEILSEQRIQSLIIESSENVNIKSNISET